MDKIKYCIEKITGIKAEKLREKNIQDLLQRPRTLGLTTKQAEKLEYLSEFIRQYNTAEFINEKKIISSSISAGEFCCNLFENIVDKEHFYIVLLNSQNEIIDTRLMFSGTVNETAIHIREIIKDVLNYNATSIILTHNHPGGSLKPSPADIGTTKKIKTALETVQVKLIDHIICTPDKNYYSFAEKGML